MNVASGPASSGAPAVRASTLQQAEVQGTTAVPISRGLIAIWLWVRRYRQVLRERCGLWVE